MSHQIIFIGSFSTHKVNEIVAEQKPDSLIAERFIS